MFVAPLLGPDVVPGAVVSTVRRVRLLSVLAGAGSGGGGAAVLACDRTCVAGAALLGILQCYRAGGLTGSKR